MTIKLTLSKPEKIRAVLDYWDPCRVHDTEKWYLLYYNYEAEELAQSIRKNSKPATVAKRVKKLIDSKLEAEGREYRVDEENAERVAAALINAVR